PHSRWNLKDGPQTRSWSGERSSDANRVARSPEIEDMRATRVHHSFRARQRIDTDFTAMDAAATQSPGRREERTRWQQGNDERAAMLTVRTRNAERGPAMARTYWGGLS